MCLAKMRMLDTSPTRERDGIGVKGIPLMFHAYRPTDLVGAYLVCWSSCFSRTDKQQQIEGVGEGNVLDAGLVRVSPSIAKVSCIMVSWRASHSTRVQVLIKIYSSSLITMTLGIS